MTQDVKNIILPKTATKHKQKKNRRHNILILSVSEKPTLLGSRNGGMSAKKRRF